MVPIDLITGFLGAGKTTFLLRYARYWLRQGKKIGILVYDHGAVNVDMPLLQELRGERCELEMLAAGCDLDCRRRRFRTKLIAMGMCGYDRVLIEPSGVFDMDDFFDTLRESPLDRWYEPGSVITVVDAKLEDETSAEEDFFLASQAASAGRIVFSRCQLAAPEELERTKAHLLRAAREIGCTASLEKRILAKDWAELTDADFAALARCGYDTADYEKTIAGQVSEFQSLSFLNLELSGEKLRAACEELLRDGRFGRILRVKGFFREGECWFRLNATADVFRVEPAQESSGALLVIGSALDEDAISLLLTGHRPEHRLL